MTNQHSIRPMFLLGFLFCLAMTGIALYAQYVMYLEPCPLCIFQRVAVMALGLIFLLGAFHNPSSSFGRRGYGQLTIIAAVTGAVIAARHVWLQHLPPEKVPACGPGLSYWLDSMPFTSVLSKVFEGSGECAEVQFRTLGLSIPEWTLIVFVMFALYGLKVLIKGR
jgi:disulfide bond formation protein DsbB